MKVKFAMENYDIYLHEKKIRYPVDHELFYAALTGQSEWIETVKANSARDALDKAKKSLLAQSWNSALKRILQRSKYMYAEDGSWQKLSYKPDKT